MPPCMQAGCHRRVLGCCLACLHSMGLGLFRECVCAEAGRKILVMLGHLAESTCACALLSDESSVPLLHTMIGMKCMPLWVQHEMDDGGLWDTCFCVAQSPGHRQRLCK